MMFLIGDNCFQCGFCVHNCKKKAIRFGDKKVKINYELCNNCGLCIKICPISCIWKFDKLNINKGLKHGELYNTI